MEPKLKDDQSRKVDAEEAIRKTHKDARDSVGRALKEEKALLENRPVGKEWWQRSK